MIHSHQKIVPLPLKLIGSGLGCLFWFRGPMGAENSVSFLLLPSVTFLPNTGLFWVKWFYFYKQNLIEKWIATKCIVINVHSFCHAFYGGTLVLNLILSTNKPLCVYFNLSFFNVADNGLTFTGSTLYWMTYLLNCIFIFGSCSS